MFIKPDYNLESIFDINFEELKAKGVKIILSDLDSTVMPSKSGEFPQNVKEWIDNLRKYFDFAIISNNKSEEYISKVKSQCYFDVIGYANKPSCKVMREYIISKGYKPTEVAMVGDRPLTDILAGKLLGCTTILVDSITKTTEKPIVRFVRKIERLSVRK